MQKVGASVIPEVTIETADGKHFKITTATSFTTVLVEFNLGEEFELTTADGRKTKVECRSLSISHFEIIRLTITI